MPRRTDSNHAEITLAFRGQGASVFSLHAVGDGCPDLLVGFAGVTALVEVKKPFGPKGGGGGKLTDDQLDFRARWRGAPVHVVRTLEDVGRLLDLLEAPWQAAFAGKETP